VTRLSRPEYECNGHQHSDDHDNYDSDGWGDYAIDSEEEEARLKQVPAHSGP
jgi:hypothetical protein